MLKEHASLFRRVTIFVDIIILIFSFFIAYIIRDSIDHLFPIDTYITLLPFFVLIWICSLYFFGMYFSFRTASFREILLIIFESSIFGFILYVNIIYILKLSDISRTLTFTMFIIAAFLITLEKIILLSFFRYLRKKGYNFKNVLIIGTGARAQNFAKLIKNHNEWGLKLIGFIDEEEQKIGQIIDDYKCIGTFNDMLNILHSNAIDHVIFVVPRLWFNKIEHLILLCETEGITVSVAMDLFELKFSMLKQTEFYGFPLLTFTSTPDKIWHLFVKRLFDIFISGIALIILLPFFIIIAIIEKSSKGSVFFKQIRSGLNGRKFTLYKFRTMIENAESKLSELLKYNEMNGPVFKMENDPRITKFGKFLRKFSIDELPQFWNVLKGDMSIIGPRPPLPSEVIKYDNWQRRRLSMRPGLTCLWQIQGRNKITDFNEWMKLDLEYIDNWSLWLDFKIFLQTIPVVLLGKGAK